MVNLILSFQDQITSRLKVWPGLHGTFVDFFPDDPDNFILSGSLAALVAYRDTAFQEPKNASGLVVQETEMEYELHILSRNPFKDRNGFRVMEEIRQALSGWRPEGARGKCYPRRMKFVSQSKGIWQYTISLVIPAMQIQLPDALSTEALMVKATFNTPFEQFEVKN